VPDAYAILLDAPDQSTTKVQIAKLGDDFHHSRYGDFKITAAEVADWKRNLSKLPGGRALIDQDHAADKQPRRTEASGWITDVDLEDGMPIATVEWTPRGEKAIRDKEYLFLSPSFGPFENEKGERFENTLQGAALTNRPHLSMPALQLASEERVSRALLGDPESGLYALALNGALGEDIKTLAGVTQAERDKAKEENNSLPDGSYPIRNVGQLKAAIVLAQSKHGDWQAARKLIERRAKELGRTDLLPDGWGDGKKLEGSPPEARPLLDRNAAELEIGDVITMMRLRKALEGVPGLNYEGVQNVWENGRARVGPQASVAEVLEAGGLNREQITEAAALVATIEAGVDAERQKVREAAPLLEKDRVYRGQHSGLPEPVYLPDDWDPGVMANKEERARRLARARANDVGGLYRSKQGADRFHREDDEAAEVGLDLARGLERRTEVAKAKAVAKGETGGIAQPIEAAVAARQEERTLEAEIAELDRTIEAEDRERADFKRRGVWRGGLAPDAGKQLAARREKMIALDDLQRSRAYSLESIPGFKLALEQPVGWKKLLAAKLAGIAPASPFDDDAIAAERQEVDRRAQKYLLDHDLPPARYLEAVEAVEAGRDRAEPVAPFRRPAPAPVQDDRKKLLDDEIADVVQRARDYCEQQGWSAGNGELFMKALDAVSPALRMPD